MGNASRAVRSGPIPRLPRSRSRPVPTVFAGSSCAAIKMIPPRPLARLRKVPSGPPSRQPDKRSIPTTNYQLLTTNFPAINYQLSNYQLIMITKEQLTERAQLVRLHEANCQILFPTAIESGFRVAIMKKIAQELGL